MIQASAFRRSGLVLFAAQALGLSLIIAASAHIRVPFAPVPMTMQTGAVMAIAAICGWRLGLAAMAAYLIEGALGLPVFAAGIGLPVLAGPTAGYLVGMAAAAVIVGSVRGSWRQALAIVVATAVIYAFGVAWLSHFVGFDRAVALGLLPFLVGDAFKGALAWTLARVLAR